MLGLKTQSTFLLRSLLSCLLLAGLGGSVRAASTTSAPPTAPASADAGALHRHIARLSAVGMGQGVHRGGGAVAASPYFQGPTLHSVAPVVYDTTGTCTLSTDCTNGDSCTNGTCTSTAGCTNGDYCTKNTGCTQGLSCTHGDGCTKATDCTNGPQCTSGPNCTGGSECTHGAACTQGANCTWSVSCTVGDNCTGGTNCTNAGTCTTGVDHCSKGTNCTTGTNCSTKPGAPANCKHKAVAVATDLASFGLNLEDGLTPRGLLSLASSLFLLGVLASLKRRNLKSELTTLSHK